MKVLDFHQLQRLEHPVMCAYGKENEVEAFERNQLEIISG